MCLLLLKYLGWWRRPPSAFFEDKAAWMWLEDDDPDRQLRRLREHLDGCDNCAERRDIERVLRMAGELSADPITKESEIKSDSGRKIVQRRKIMKLVLDIYKRLEDLEEHGAKKCFTY